MLTHNIALTEISVVCSDKDSELWLIT